LENGIILEKLEKNEMENAAGQKQTELSLENKFSGDLI